jgi:hypothetical protein
VRFRARGDRSLGGLLPPADCPRDPWEVPHLVSPVE